MALSVTRQLFCLDVKGRVLPQLSTMLHISVFTYCAGVGNSSLVIQSRWVNIQTADFHGHAFKYIILYEYSIPSDGTHPKSDLVVKDKTLVL